MRNYPIIIKLEVAANFRYIWLKYVNDVDLNQHCAKCLIGPYSTKIQHTTRYETNIHLDEAEPKYYYLCGVSRPYKWLNNFHLAFRYKKGFAIEAEGNGILIIIKDAEEIKFSSEDINPSDPNYKNKLFFTCRNWQFAHKVFKESY